MPADNIFGGWIVAQSTCLLYKLDVPRTWEPTASQHLFFQLRKGVDITENPKTRAPAAELLGSPHIPIRLAGGGPRPARGQTTCEPLSPKPSSGWPREEPEASTRHLGQVSCQSFRHGSRLPTGEGEEGPAGVHAGEM